MADFTQPIQPVGSGGSGGGSMSMSGMGPDYGTLDEPVTETIMRDVRMVGNKMMCVLNPRKANIQTLKDWDLWGPLILCLMLATLLSWFAPYEQKSLVFASVFVIIWCGAAVVTVNALLLGGNISFFQSVCVLGYCIFPLNIASIVCLVGGPFLWRTLVVAVCFFWSTGASLGAHPQRLRTVNLSCRSATHAGYARAQKSARCQPIRPRGWSQQLDEQRTHRLPAFRQPLSRGPVIDSLCMCPAARVLPWSGFMGELVPPNRKALAVYPLFLFYTAIGWLILIAAKQS